MARIWLAAVLGILLGVTLAYTTGASVASLADTAVPMVPFQAQLRTTQEARPVQSDSRLIFVSLLAGIVVAAPVFLVAKKRA